MKNTNKNKRLMDARFRSLVTSISGALPEAKASMTIIHDLMLDMQGIVRLDGDQYE